MAIHAQMAAGTGTKAGSRPSLTHFCFFLPKLFGQGLDGLQLLLQVRWDGLLDYGKWALRSPWASHPHFQRPRPGVKLPQRTQAWGEGRGERRQDCPQPRKKSTKGLTSYGALGPLAQSLHPTPKSSLFSGPRAVNGPRAANRQRLRSLLQHSLLRPPPDAVGFLCPNISPTALQRAWQRHNLPHSSPEAPSLLSDPKGSRRGGDCPARRPHKA